MQLIPNPPGEIVGGEILYKGQDLVKKSEKDMQKIRGNEISMIFQEPMSSLNPVYRIGDQMLEMIDVLVDGEFIEAQKDITLRFRGSSNQRIIDVKKSREAQQVVLSPLQKKREF